MKRLIALLLSILCVFSFASCSKGVLDTKKPSKEDTKVVGTAAGYDIIYDELRCLTLSYKAVLENKYGKGIWDKPETAEKYSAELKELVTEAIVINISALKLASDNGITPKDKKAKELVDIYMNQLATDLAKRITQESGATDYSPSRKEINDAYAKYLEESFLTDSYYRYNMSIDACIELLKQKLIEDDKLIIDDETISKYVDKNFRRVYHIRTATMADAELVHWILTSNLKLEEKRDELRSKLGITPDTPAQDSKRKLLGRLIDASNDGEKMEILIGSAYNKDTEMQKNGYYFTHGEFSEDYEKQAFSIEVGDISEIVTAPEGFYIIQRLELDESYVKLNLDVLKDQYHYAYINSLIEENTSKITFSLNDYGSSLDLTKIK